jgi:hypothetical protein
MPPMRKAAISNPLQRALVLLLVSLGLSHAADVPTGFDLNRYQKLWERNPFALPTHATAQAQPTLFDKLVLVSWMKDGKKDVVFVQNTETNEVQKITREPNSNNLKLVELHPSRNPKLAEVLLSNGADQGPVKFKMESPNPEQGGQSTALPPGMTQMMGPQSQRVPQVPGQAQNPLLQSLSGGQAGAAPGQQPQTYPGASPSPSSPDNQMRPPRAQEIRRKRVLPPQQQQMQVMPPAGGQPLNQRQTQ